MNIRQIFRDPRHYQIFSLSFLVLYGTFALDFAVRPERAAAMLLTALGMQWLLTQLMRTGEFEPRSALISGLGLCMLLRVSSVWMAILAAAITIGGKFLIRFRGKHIFNPTNLAIVLMILFSGGAWVCPGQWGNAAWFGFLILCMGGMVVCRAARYDTTLAFLGFHLAILFGRALWLGDPLSIPLHQFQNGTMLVFAFFMISDPKTTPNSRAGRILFTALVALGAGYVQFVLYRTSGILYSLAVCSLLVPLIDRLLPGKKYEWNQPDTYFTKGEAHEPASSPAYAGGFGVPQPAG